MKAEFQSENFKHFAYDICAEYQSLEIKSRDVQLGGKGKLKFESHHPQGCDGSGIWRSLIRHSLQQRLCVCSLMTLMASSLSFL
mmetsp:Transcript_27230/g.50434  ORF Transcript_27230/g.50434 Transcript_27230/m.50434 type:complete len:84 (-) Transcript_27230:271-522(-)